jgi:hypothetical protein
LRHPLHKCGLPSSQLSLQADQIAGHKAVSQPRTYSPRLVRGTAEEIECMLVEDRHARIIRHRMQAHNLIPSHQPGISRLDAADEDANLAYRYAAGNGMLTF